MTECFTLTIRGRVVKLLNFDAQDIDRASNQDSIENSIN